MTLKACRQVPIVVALAVVLVGCQVGGAPTSGREGYFTWVDEQGRVRYSPIPEQASAGDKDSEAGAPETGATSTASSEEQETPPALQPEEEYTLENYPDAEELARDGYVRPGEPRPYFTWRDAEGNIRVSYYTPDTRTDVQKGRVPAPVEITPASIHQAGAARAPEAPVEGYDPEALAILGVDEQDSFFSRFAESCCQNLSTGERHAWISGREFEVDIVDASTSHEFDTGTSRFALVSLPDPREYPDFVFRLRSFDHNGLFVPSLAFLDEELRPVRVVTDMAMGFEPESWHSRGYLQAWIPAFPARGERWLVIFTRAEDLGSQTVVETGQGPQSIPHAGTGELGLRLIAED